MKFWIAGGALVAAAAASGTLSAQIEPGNAPMAGEYSARISFISIDLPGAPPQMADMMSRMMSRTTTYCLTEEEIAEGYRAITDRSMRDGANDCSYERFDFSGGAIDAVMLCEMDGRDMRMEMQGSGNATSSDITMTISGDFGIGEGTMKMRAQHERIGDCSRSALRTARVTNSSES